MSDFAKPQKAAATALPIQHQKALLALLVLLLFLLVPPAITGLLSGLDSNARSTSANETPPEQIAATLNVAPEAPDTRLIVEVKAGDSLSSIFKRAGFGAQLVDDIGQSSSDTRILSNIYPGYRLAFETNDAKELVSLEIMKSRLESFKFTRTADNNFSFEHLKKEPEIRQVIKEAIITESLFLAAQRGGIPAAMAQELAGIFSGVIDFYIDTREGDSFRVIYEDHYLGGEWIGYGKILAAEFINQGTVFTALRYVDKDGKANFFSPQGESMRKAFLKNPVDFTRISSGFALSRKHPILNTIRAHKGTDYAAPRGTQVVATADGRVTFAASDGSFGKLVVIQHGDRFVTKYAHLNAFANGIKSGVRVKQNEIIGYVGSTGSATGPHLHYEFLMDGIHRDSRKIVDQLPKAESINPEEMTAFRSQTASYVAALDAQRTTTATIASTASSSAGTSTGTAANVRLME